MKRVLVTGASGCIGRHVLPILTAAGWEVHGITSSGRTSGTPGVTWHHSNLLDAAAVDRVVAQAGATHLLHLAWYIAPGRWAAAPENLLWVRASLGLFEAFRRSGGTRVVTAGSCLEYDWRYGYCAENLTPCTPHTVYGACKHALQILAAALADSSDGLQSAWARIFFVYGPHEHPDRLVASVARSLLAGQPAATSHGTQVRDYLFVEDVADALAELLDSKVTGPINVGSGRAVELKEIVVRLGEIVGRPDLLRVGAIPPAPTDMPLVVADVTRLSAALGWRPKWSIDAGLRRTIEWWAEQAPSLVTDRRPV